MNSLRKQFNVQSGIPKYIGHVTHTSGTGREIFKSIALNISKNISLHDVIVAGCDGDSINTGLKKGVIKI